MPNKLFESIYIATKHCLLSVKMKLVVTKPRWIIYADTYKQIYIHNNVGSCYFPCISTYFTFFSRTSYKYSLPPCVVYCEQQSIGPKLVIIYIFSLWPYCKYHLFRYMHIKFCLSNMKNKQLAFLSQFCFQIITNSQHK